MAIQFADRVRVTTASTGTGTITLGAAVLGFRSFGAAVTAGALASGATVYYGIDDINNGWEIGWGIFTDAALDTLTRNVTSSSLGGLPLALSGAAQVYLTASADAIADATSAQVVASFANGNVIIGSNTASPNLIINGASGTARNITWSSAGVLRWCVYADSTAEGGNNLGSNFAIGAYTDAGASATTPFQIVRSTGRVLINNGLTIAGTTSVPNVTASTSNLQIANTAFVLGQLSATIPLVDSTASAGVSDTIARADHVHPIDTSRQAALGFTPAQQNGGIGQGSNHLYLGWASGGGAAKITVDSTDLGNIVTTNFPQGFALLNSSVTFANVQVIGSGNGSIQMSLGTSTAPGYVAFFNAAGLRQGFAGTYQVGSTTALILAAENGALGWTCAAFAAALDAPVTGNVTSSNYAQTSAFAYAGNGVTYSYYWGLDGSNNRRMNYSTDNWGHYWRASDGAYIFQNYQGVAMYYCTGTGNVVATGNVFAANVSDERTKTNIEPYTRGLADLIQLKPVSFEFNGLGGSTKDGKRQYGVTAQQAQPFVPECVEVIKEMLPPKDGEPPPAPIRLPGQLGFNEKPLIFASVNAFKEIEARLRRIEQAMIDQHLR